jgi:hypothetical protein
MWFWEILNIASVGWACWTFVHFHGGFNDLLAVLLQLPVSEEVNQWLYHCITVYGQLLLIASVSAKFLEWLSAQAENTKRRARRDSIQARGRR